MNITNDERRVSISILDAAGNPVEAVPHPDTWDGDCWRGRLLIQIADGIGKACD